MAALLAFVLILPLPLVNDPVGVALVCLSLGVLRKDGLLIALGFVVGVLSLAGAVVVTTGLVLLGAHL